MTIKNILKIACLFLGKENIVNVLNLEDYETASDSEKSEVQFLISCLNLVYEEVATDYIPLYVRENVSLDDNKILIKSLSKKLLEVISIKDRNGYKVKYKNFPNHLEVDGVASEILYRYQPDEISKIDDEIECFSNKITEKVFAFGVAMEYCFIQGLYDDAQIWEKRFKDALLVRASKKSNMKLPVRRWI